MRRYISRISSLVLTLSVMIGANSCEHKELCYYHPHVAPVRVNVDWSLFTMEQPTGMTAYAYTQDSKGEHLHRFITHDIDYITMELEAGFFNSIVYNQSESEYGTIEFTDLESYNDAQVKVVQTKSSWYSTKAPETKVGTEPEWFGVGRVEMVEVTEEMVEIAEKEHLAQLGDQMARAIYTKTVNEVATVVPIGVIKQIEFRIYGQGLYNLRSARGAVEGLAEGCVLSTGQTTDIPVAHTMDAWHLETEPDDPASGDIVTVLSTFGLPQGHSGTAAENKFTLNLLLVDNKTQLTYDYLIGDILAQFEGMDGLDGQIQKVVVELELPERLPDVMPVGGSGGGFDASVDDWGDEISTTIPIS